MEVDDKFLIIAFTLPDIMPDEAVILSEMLENGIDFIHLRKPQASLRDIKNLIEDIPYALRCRLRLHGHFELLNDFNVAGVQINSRCPEVPRNAISVSRSCHSVSECIEAFDNGMAYSTLSPIFDSISKENYQARFNPEDISESIRGKKVIALGGVSPFNFLQLKRCGFYGAAMLGWLYDDSIPLREKLNIVNQQKNVAVYN